MSYKPQSPTLFPALAALSGAAGRGKGGGPQELPALAGQRVSPSLHFKSIGKPNWSVRVGDHYRAIGQFIGEEFVWEWIGSHADYDKRI